ncbi:MAG: hypothetical protein HYT98_02155 [Candidatus Sungbacteria bacterium]|nr:hypothetical protein [Candidatus Sungbacteria bacterium]
MYKKVPTDGIRKKSKPNRLESIPVEDPFVEPSTELIPAAVQEKIQEGAEALERFMRRKSMPAADMERAEEEENSVAPEENPSEGMETVSSPEGEILIIEPPPDQITVTDEDQDGWRKMQVIRGWLARVAILVSKKFFTRRNAEPEESRPSNFISQSRKIMSIKGGIITGLGAVIIIFILLSTVFARLTVHISPRAEQINIRDVTALFDASVVKLMPEKKVIPAERLEFTRNISKEFETTGKELVEERARGKVKIYNRFSSSPQGLIANTRFLTDSGVLYRLSSAVIIPGAKIENGSIVPQFIEAELLADSAGTEANLDGEIRLNIPAFKGGPKYDGFYAMASAGFSGGFEGEARVISKEDLSAAEKAVTKTVFDELRDEMKRKIPPEFKSVEEFSETEITKVVSPQARMRTEKFVVEASARGRVLIFRERDVRDLVRFIVIGDDASKKLVDQSAELNYRIRSGDLKSGRVEAVINGKVRTEFIIPRESLVQDFLAKKEGTIAEIMKSRADIAGFRISIFPPWRASAPGNPDKIKLIVEGQ